MQEICAKGNRLPEDWWKLYKALNAGTGCVAVQKWACDTCTTTNTASSCFRWSSTLPRLRHKIELDGL